MKIVHLSVRDIRFPTSRQLDGSDAMNAAPDYSAAYVTLKTDDGAMGFGLTFTIGRGNEVVVAAVKALAPLVLGRELEAIRGDMGAFWRSLVGDSQLRWIGPEKGAIHLAAAAIVNAIWDLWARLERKPVWKLLTDMTPEQVVRCLDFRFVTDALTSDEALVILRRAQKGKGGREREILERGYPAYTTGPGWLGYSEDKMRGLALEALDQGFTAIKQKVGGGEKEDCKRAAILREAIGSECLLMMDANQVWEIDEAIKAMRALAEFDPYWIEEPTSPDEVLGHARIRQAIKPIRVATGEHCQNRIIFKQLMQAGAIDVCQLDVARLGGLNEAIVVLLMAAKFGVPVCPHGGGVGLCEYIQHVSMFDYTSVSGSMEDRFIEHVSHLHEHFVDPIRIENERYRTPVEPFSVQFKQGVADQYEFAAST